MMLRWYSGALDTTRMEPCCHVCQDSGLTSGWSRCGLRSVSRSQRQDWPAWAPAPAFDTLSRAAALHAFVVTSRWVTVAFVWPVSYLWQVSQNCCSLHCLVGGPVSATPWDSCAVQSRAQQPSTFKVIKVTFLLSLNFSELLSKCIRLLPRDRMIRPLTMCT